MSDDFDGPTWSWRDSAKHPTFWSVMLPRSPEERGKLLDDARPYVMRAMTTAEQQGASDEIDVVLRYVLSDEFLAIDDIIEAAGDEPPGILRVETMPEPDILRRTIVMRGEERLGVVTVRWAEGETFKIEVTR
jgi:hypothetical protein